MGGIVYLWRAVCCLLLGRLCRKGKHACGRRHSSLILGSDKAKRLARPFRQASPSEPPKTSPSRKGSATPPNIGRSGVARTVHANTSASPDKLLNSCSPCGHLLKMDPRREGSSKTSLAIYYPFGTSAGRCFFEAGQHQFRKSHRCQCCWLQEGACRNPGFKNARFTPRAACDWSKPRSS